MQTFHFNKSGAATNPDATAKLTVRRHRGVIGEQEAPLHVTIRGTGFKSLISQGVAVDANGLPEYIVVVLGLNGETLSYVDTITFTTKKAISMGKFGYK